MNDAWHRVAAVPPAPTVAEEVRVGSGGGGGGGGLSELATLLGHPPRSRALAAFEADLAARRPSSLAAVLPAAGATAAGQGTAAAALSTRVKVLLEASPLASDASGAPTHILVVMKPSPEHDEQ